MAPDGATRPVTGPPAGGPEVAFSQAYLAQTAAPAAPSPPDQLVVAAVSPPPSPAWTALAACTGGGGLELRLTDAPPDTDNMASVVVTLSSAEAHFAKDGDDTDGPGKKDDLGTGGDGGWVRVSGPPLSYDLLRLQNGVSELIGDIALPPGKITQLGGRTRVE